MTIDPLLKKKMLRYRWVILGALTAAYFFIYFHRTTGGSISNILMERFVIADGGISLLASAYLYGYTLMLIPSGLITDKWGVRNTALMGSSIVILGSFLCAYSDSISIFNMMIVGKFIIGMGATGISVPILKQIAVWFRENEFATISSILYMVGNLGGIVATTPVVVIMGALGVGTTYLLLGIIAIVTCALIWIFVRDHPNDMGYPSVEDIEAEETGKPREKQEVEKIGALESLKIVLTSGSKLWPLSMWMGLTYGAIMIWAATYAGIFYENIGGFDSVTASMFLSLIPIGTVFGSVFAGRLSDKVLRSRKKVIIISTIGQMVAWVFILLSAYTDIIYNVALQYAINFVLGFTSAFSIVAYAQVKELFPISITGTSTSTMNCITFGGGALIVSLSGLVMSNNTLEEFQTLWIISALIMVASFVFAILSVEKKMN